MLVAMVPRARWLYLLLSAAALAAYLWAFAEQAGRAGWPEEIPAQRLAYPVTIGSVQAGSPGEVQLVANGYPAGSKVRLITATGEERAVTLPREHSLTHILITALTGLFFWAVNTIVFAPRSADRMVRGFFWCTLLFGLAVMIGESFVPHANVWPSGALSLLRGICITLLGVLFVHLALHFPRPNPLRDRARWLLPVLWGLAIILSVWLGGALLRYILAPDPVRARALPFPRGLVDGALVAQVGFGLALLFTSSRRLELTRERQQAKWLLWGIALGASPYVFLRTLPQLVGLPAPFGGEFDRLLELAFPIGFAFAVVRHRFLDIDIIIRRSLIYAILTALTLALYVVFGLALGQRLQGTWGSWMWVLLIAVGLIAGMLFNPLRRGIGRWVDRTFFKISYSHGQALRVLREDLSHASSQIELAGILDRFFASTLGLRAHAVAVRRGDEWAVAGSWTREQIAAAWEDFATLTRGRADTLIAAPNHTSLIELEAAGFPAALAADGVALLQSMPTGQDCAGLILLGEKETERRFIETDVALISSATEEAARVLERICLVQAVAEETLARRRLDELDRLKNDFLSRVAHDLRTPLASVSWSIENLIDGVAGEVSDSQRDYLRSMKTSAGHLNRLVQNLLEISRLERGTLAIEISPVALAPVLEQVVVMFRPLAAEREVRLVLDVDPAAAPVYGHEQKLVEVATNLIDNALRYSPRGGKIEVTVPARDRSRQRFTVRDHGPGLGDADSEQLFARFHQGPPSPHTQTHGFGLGLYIVRSYIERMAGEVTARNHPGGGAEFTCWLPIAGGVAREPGEGT
jgi:signal transduction histidine kinase